LNFFVVSVELFNRIGSSFFVDCFGEQGVSLRVRMCGLSRDIATFIEGVVMFSGIVEAVGTVENVQDTGGGMKFRIVAPSILGDAQTGESIAVNGTCLTVIEYSREWFDVEVTQETLRCTTLGALKTGRKVNLEKALKLSDRLGGHMVTGHVDTVGHVSDIQEDGFSKIMKFTMEKKWAGFFVKKGSVTVEGVSLTVADCGQLTGRGQLTGHGELTNNSSGDKSDDEFWFTVALIPHTMDVTTLGAIKVGDPVNVETDVIARYVVRLLGDSYLENLNKERESVL